MWTGSGFLFFFLLESQSHKSFLLHLSCWAVWLPHCCLQLYLTLLTVSIFRHECLLKVYVLVEDVGLWLKRAENKKKEKFWVLPLLIFIFLPFFFFFIVEVSPDCAERLRGALRFSSCSHHVGQPGASAPIPPVWDLVCRWEHERHGIYPLLPSYPSLLPPNCSWLCRQVSNQYMQDPFTAMLHKENVTVYIYKWT